MIERDVLQATLPFWEQLNREQQDELARRVKTQNFERGACIHDAQQACIGVFFVLSGAARASMMSEEGKELTLFHLKKGEGCVLSASCVMPLVTFDILVHAVEDTQLLVIPSDFFGSLIEDNIYAQAYTYKEVTTRFSEVMWVMQQQLFMRFDKRLAIFLLDESARTQSDCLQLTHEEIAKQVGSAREVVTRTLKQFASEGLVEPFRGGLFIKNKSALYAK